MLMAQTGAARRIGGMGRVVRLIFFGVLLGVSVFLTVHYLHSSNGSFSLSQTSADNKGVGAGFGSSGVPYSASPLDYPRDFYYVLLDPLPVTAHSASQFLAALENSVIVVIVLASLRNLRMVVRASFARGYVMMSLIFTLGFIYAFAALGNLGLITRERSALFPFLLVLVCIPRSPKGLRPRFEWELRRKDRLRFRIAARARPAVPGPDVPVPDAGQVVDT
jgi:hypothetical protein